MKLLRYSYLIFPILLSSCAITSDKNTLASLRDVKIEIKEEKIENSLDKAMASYQRFLEETPETEMTPEAIRRLADLKIEKEYGVASDGEENEKKVAIDPVTTATVTTAPLLSSDSKDISDEDLMSSSSKSGVIADIAESRKKFEKRASKEQQIKKPKDETNVVLPGDAADDLLRAGALEAIELYKGLLIKYPLYERNDQVLYQLSRAYEEIGKVEEAVKILDKLVVAYPASRHIDEAQFRRAEYFFTRKKYLDAEEAYLAVINIGIGSAFYELALYKQGWAFFKQELYEEALNDFIALLDYKISIGFDFDDIKSKIEEKRIEDTYRVISLSFSYLGGAQSIVEFFDKHGPRSYEASIYSHLGEYYLDKRRYADAALSYNTYVERNPINKVSPYFNIRVIEIYLKGGFPKLVIDAKKNFSTIYGLRAEYWTYFDINEHSEVLAFLKANLVDLANHYHSLYQNKRLRKFKQDNYQESIHWYRMFLESFPEDALAPGMNFQLAELFLENKDFRDAALAYERTSYDYPKHDKSSAAGYAAVFSYREHLKKVNQSERTIIKREIIRTSLKFSDIYPKHKKAAIVLVSAMDDIYALKNYILAVSTGRKVLANYADADKKLIRATWLIVAHASFDLSNYKDAEEAYSQVLVMTSKKDKSYNKLIENLAASIYKQGEQARKLADHRAAANHFLRVATITPTSKIRPAAEYDAAASLITLKDWPKAAEVLEAFRKRYPKHKLQKDITKRLAVVYKEDKKYLLAAAEFERVETETKDDDLRREALLQAAELYEKANDKNHALLVYSRYVRYFPKPIEFALETRQKIADIYKLKKDKKKYTKQLQIIVAVDLKAGKERTDRTRFLAANASLVLAETSFRLFKNVKLVKPFKKNLKKKKKRMKKAIAVYGRLIDYEVGIVTAAATYNIAEIYYHFSRALMNSERPGKLNELEAEQYELALEEQVYPFEEKAIKVHEKNMELLERGIYNKWIDKSLEKLAKLLPARYAKSEERSEFVKFIVPKKPEPKRLEVPEDVSAEETKLEESKVEDIKVDETKVEEINREVETEKPVLEKVKLEEAKPEEVKAEEAKAEETKQKNSGVVEATEEVESEENALEKVKVDEAKSEGIKVEVAKPKEVEEEKVKEEVELEKTILEKVKADDTKSEGIKLEEIKPKETEAEKVKEKVDAVKIKPEEIKVEVKKLKDIEVEEVKPEKTTLEKVKSEEPNMEKTNVEESIPEKENQQSDNTSLEQVIDESLPGKVESE
jgi:cellulose synthase operon protein C